ncbi:PAS domain S-box protein [Halorubrum trueperi]|uniref:histidine kinase n=1 Tax=Halorubrum trueperi TaxID=2004704 RepID=A0ABD5UK58_9EURY
MTERDQSNSHANASMAVSRTASVPIRVLVVGDDPDGTGGVASSIVNRGKRFDVQAASNAEAGLNAVENGAFDCVVSGYALPDADGIDLLKRVRDRHGSLPFVLFTGQGSEVVASEAVSADVDEYLPADELDDPHATLASRIDRVVSASRTERQFADHLDRMTDAFCRINAEWRFTYLNDRAAELFDRDAGDLLGDRIWDRFLGIAGTAVEERFRTAMETGEPTNFEFHFDRVSADLAVDVYPSETGLSVYFRDVTERTRRERELRELSDRLRLALEGANIGVWDWDLRTDEVRFDDRWAAILGYERSDITFDVSEWEDRIHPDDVDDVWSALNAHFVGETEFYRCDHRLRSKDGDWKWIRDRGRVVERDEGGEPVRAVGIYVDVTEEKERERDLERTSARLEALYEGSPDMIDIHDASGKIVDANLAMTAGLGYDREEMVGMDVWDIDEEMDPDEAYDVWEGLETGETVRLETTFRRADGTSLPVEVHVRRVDVRGEDRFLASSRDISDRKAYERRIERENERLDEFASIVSHDLRNPLSVLSGYLHLARETGDEAYFERCESAIDEMERLIDDVLTLARQSDTVESVDPIAVDELVARYAADEFGSIESGSASESHVDGSDSASTIDVDVDIDRDVFADPGRLKRLFGNLFRNAAEHGGDRVVVGDLPGGFYVTDDGPGVPADRRDEVFESGYSTTETGTGFGLAIVKRIAEAHGWEVSLSESESGGARFEFTGVERP